MEHVPHLEGITDTATLFILSADATPEDVREWFVAPGLMLEGWRCLGLVVPEGGGQAQALWQQA